MSVDEAPASPPRSDSLRLQVQALEAELSQSRAQYKSSEQRVIALEDELSGLKQTVVSLKGQNENLERQVKRKTGEKTVLENVIQTLKTEIEREMEHVRLKEELVVELRCVFIVLIVFCSPK